MGCLYHFGKVDDAIEHELSSSYHNIRMKRFCVYHEKDFGRLREERKETLRKHRGKELLIIRAKLNNRSVLLSFIIQWFSPTFL